MQRLGLGIASSVLAMAAGTTVGSAQSAPPVSLTPAPTIKVLAIGHLTATANPSTMRPVMPSEVRATVQLYLGGKIDQWYVRQDKSGVVFLMNVSSVDEAHALLEKLPLGEQKLMEFDLIPLGPLTPLSLLLGAPAPATGARP